MIICIRAKLNDEIVACVVAGTLQIGHTKLIYLLSMILDLDFPLKGYFMSNSLYIHLRHILANKLKLLNTDSPKISPGVC